MRIFGHHFRTPVPAHRAADGHGSGTLTCRARRCLYGDVAVVDVDKHPAARAAVAGPRPARDEPWREKVIRVRLVRAYDDPDDPNAIDILTDAGLPLGHVCRTSARRMAPAIDDALDAIAAKRECKECTVDIYCTALVVAEWDRFDDALAHAHSDGPAVVELTLLVDDVDLGLALAAPEIPVCV
jgi:hypothetical protein